MAKSKKEARVAKMKDQSAKLFVQYQALAVKMAAKFSKTYGKPLPEMLDEAKSVLGMIAARWNEGGASGYDPSRCNPTSWVYRALYWELLDYCTRGQDKARTFSTLEADDEKPMEIESQTAWLESLTRMLGEDAKVLVRTIVMAPAEIAEDVLPSTRGRARKAVRSYLQKQGWAAERLERAWAEVEVTL